MTVLVVAAVVVAAVLLTARGRAVARAASQRCQELLRRQHRERDLKLVRRLPRPEHRPLELPSCEECGRVYTDIEDLRRHAAEHDRDRQR